jgi:hypothetical protein
MKCPPAVSRHLSLALNTEPKHFDARLVDLHALLALAQTDATKGEPGDGKAGLLLIQKVQGVPEGMM